MPSVASKRTIMDSDDEIDEESPKSSPPPPRKRGKLEHRNGRVNGHDEDDAGVDGEEVDGEVDGEIDEEGDEEPEFENALPPAEVDIDAEEDLLREDYEITKDELPYQPGAIVRVTVENFVTYTTAEMRPGPSLNMIIGPNGTGKSSLVCAICIGLGYPPGLLGRATDVSAFVKNGTQEAFVEVELQGHEGERNTVIKRKISRDDNKSTYWLNGKSATHSAIQKVTRKFNIQIDNLCQFLPQDRVSEFAELPNTEKLVQTVRAAAPPEMLEYHKSLIELGKQVDRDRDVLDNDKTQLRQLEARQAVLQQDVDRLRERQEVIAKIELLEKMKPYIKYRESRVQWLNKKQQHKDAVKELHELEAEMKPAMERPQNKAKYRAAVKEVLGIRSGELKTKEAEINRHKNNVIPKCEEHINSVKADIAAAQKTEAKRKEDIRNLKKKADDLKKKVEAGPPEFDLAYYQGRESELRSTIRQLTNESHDVKERSEARKHEMAQVKTQKQAAELELQNLDSLAGQRESLLARDPVNADTHKAWRWYQQNKDLFEMEIFGPPILTVSVKNPRYANAVETLIRNVSMAFVCQTRNDYFKFTKEILGGQGYQGLGLTNVTIKEFSGTKAPRLQDQQRPFTQEQLARWGFDGVALDFLEGPEPVLNMLCHESAVHATPISLKPFGERENMACDSAGLNTWVHGNTAMSVRRRYGASTTQVISFGEAKIYKTQQADPHRRSEIGRTINELTDNLNEMQQEMDRWQREYREIRTKIEAAQKEQRAVSDEKNKKQEAAQKFKSYQPQLEIAEERLQEAQRRGSQHKQEIEKLEKKLDEAVAKRAQAAIEFARLVGELVDTHNEMITLRLRYTEALSDEKILESKNRMIIQRQKDKKSEVESLLRESQQLKTKAAKHHQEMKEVMATLTEEDHAIVANVPPEKTLEHIEEDIQMERARLELIHEGNPNALKQYEERAAKISNLQKKIQEHEARLEEKDTAIKQIRDQFEPELDKLIAKISAAFSKSFRSIGCAGEIRVYKSEEGFDKWEVQALVKFREGEKLQVLNAQRQSGGERSVSTVFYLMALQSLAKSPFRLVDEINQGMDPRNERAIHHRMVNIACQEYTSQYFLITPKLLSDLMYHPRMRIHCVYSGEWVAEDFHVDVKRYLKTGRKLMAKREKLNGTAKA